MLIPLDSLEPATLRAVVAEFVTRDGTDTGEAEAHTEQVLRQLRAGLAELHYDEETGTTTVMRVPGR
jgi:hypothetical protein